MIIVEQSLLGLLTLLAIRVCNYTSSIIAFIFYGGGINTYQRLVHKFIYMHYVGYRRPAEETESLYNQVQVKLSFLANYIQ